MTLGDYKHETDFEDRRNKMLEKITTARSQVQVKITNRNELENYNCKIASSGKNRMWVSEYQDTPLLKTSDYQNFQYQKSGFFLSRGSAKTMGCGIILYAVWKLTKTCDVCASLLGARIKKKTKTIQ